jgi:hypothetical protein
MYVAAGVKKGKFIFFAEIEIQDGINHRAPDITQKVAQKRNAVFVAIANQFFDLMKFKYV